MRTRAQRKNALLGAGRPARSAPRPRAGSRATSGSIRRARKKAATEVEASKSIKGATPSRAAAAAIEKLKIWAKLATIRSQPSDSFWCSKSTRSMSRMRWITLSSASASWAHTAKRRISQTEDWKGSRPSPAAESRSSESTIVFGLVRSERAPPASEPASSVVFSAASTSEPSAVETSLLTRRIETRLRPIEPTLFAKVVSRTGRLCRNAGESSRPFIAARARRSGRVGDGVRDPGEQVPELGRAGQALVRVRLERSVDQQVEGAGQVRGAARGPAVAARELDRHGSLEGPDARSHLVEHRAEREEVALLAHDAVLLLRGHVVRRADHAPRDRLLGRGGGRGAARDAEVQDLHAAAGQDHHVRGLE